MLCGNGLYRDSGKNVAEEGIISNTCYHCSSCITQNLAENVLGSFLTQQCTSTSDTVCNLCRSSCGVGSYITAYCTTTADMTCAPCTTRCNEGFYLSGRTCSGNDFNVDNVLASCIACYTVDSCTKGEFYLSGLCDGTTQASNTCTRCDKSKPCNSGFYRGGCSGLQDTICVPFTSCNTGFYLTDESQDRDGTCRQCSTCVGTSVVRPCTKTDDIVCRGTLSCSDRSPCNQVTASNRSSLFCDYSQGSAQASCGVCPAGYASDGQYCVECPRGFTCNRVGQPICRGQCGAGIESECDTELGLNYAVCTTPCKLPILGTRQAWRGSFELAEGDDCATYFLCIPGTYKNFSTAGTISCDGCRAGLLPGGARWVTDGLSVEDEDSCLWDCMHESHVPSADGRSCVAKPGRSQGLTLNAAGSWNGRQGGGVCGLGLTSQENAAMDPTECLECQPLVPDIMRWADKTSQCEFECMDETDAKQGSKCVPERWLCDTEGILGETCLPQAYPWNRPGYGKAGWKLVNTVQFEPSAAIHNPMITIPFGIKNRHTYKETSVSTARRVEGQLCSTVTATIGGYKYMFGAPCNQSFLVYLNLSGPVDIGIKMLIGNTTRGWRDGFKTQALFESELHLAWADGALFVLDTWNCLLREVVVWDRPGSYLTRVYTLWGNTEKLALATPEAKCYGEDSLAWPRSFWPLTPIWNEPTQWLAFWDETRLWQFSISTRELLEMVKWEDIQVNAGDMYGMGLQSNFQAGLVLNSRLLMIFEALSTPCPDQRTSLAGGDCTVECVWLDAGNRPSRYVDMETGLCKACTTPICGRGEELVQCTPKADSFCRLCGAVENSTYAEAGTCDSGNLRPVPPCTAGWYMVDSGLFCEQCPVYTATRFPGATRREQCKCVDGMVRKGGAGCVAERLFEFDTVCAGSVCQAPSNGRLKVDDGVTCGWACNNGFYRDSQAGFMDSCRQCLVGAGRTPGDDDEPWSCE